MVGVRLCGVVAGATLAVGAPAWALEDGQAVSDPWRVSAEARFVDGPAALSSTSFEPLGGPFGIGASDWRAGGAEVSTEAWRVTASGAVERLRLEMTGTPMRLNGGLLPPSPADPWRLESEDYSVSYARGWPARRHDAQSGLQLEFIPHAGFGVGSEGGQAEAGAVIRVGSSLSRLVPEGDDAFDDDQARWYVFAAGSRRAVGYNFARTRDGDFVRSGMSHDSGAFIGDAQVGVAWRRGDMQTSFGYVYRKHKVRELVGRDFERERSEGVLAFQLSIRPDW